MPSIKVSNVAACETPNSLLHATLHVKVRKGKERKGKERTGKERKGKERKGKERIVKVR